MLCIIKLCTILYIIWYLYYLHSVNNPHTYHSEQFYAVITVHHFAKNQINNVYKFSSVMKTSQKAVLYAWFFFFTKKHSTLLVQQIFEHCTKVCLKSLQNVTTLVPNVLASTYWTWMTNIYNCELLSYPLCNFLHIIICVVNQELNVYLLYVIDNSFVSMQCFRNTV